MTWSIIATLIAVMVGTIGSLAGTYLVTRTTASERAAVQSEVRRQDLRSAVREFLACAQEVEAVATHKWLHAELLPSAGAEVHRLWLHQKYIDLVGDEFVRSTALDFAWRLDRAVWQGTPPDYGDVWAYMKGPRDRFLNAARQALHVDG